MLKNGASAWLQVRMYVSGVNVWAAPWSLFWTQLVVVLVLQQQLQQHSKLGALPLLLHLPLLEDPLQRVQHFRQDTMQWLGLVH